MLIVKIKIRIWLNRSDFCVANVIIVFSPLTSSFLKGIMKLKIVTCWLILWVSLTGLAGCNLDTGKTTIVDNKPQSSEYVEGEIIVKFKEGDFIAED